VVLWTANGQTDGVKRAKCPTKECMEIGAPRGRYDALPPPGGEDDMKIESGICPGHDFTMVARDQLILNLGTNHCSAPSGRWPSAVGPTTVRSPFGAHAGVVFQPPPRHQALPGIARPANQPVAAPAMLPTHSDEGEAAIPNNLGTRISPAAIMASRTSGIARPAPQRPPQ
jgi:hypothetical protein